ncbi:hypothetical protein ABVT39_007752 [Epinephelus coioides]
MAATLCQVLGFILSLIGLAGIIAATGMDQWATQDRLDDIVTSVFYSSGLWRSCVQQSSGFAECRPYFTILGLPVNRLHVVRVGAVLNISRDRDGHVELARPICECGNKHLHLLRVVEHVCRDSIRYDTVQAVFHHPGTASSASGRSCPDDCRYCSRSHRLPDCHFFPEVLENGEHGGQHESNNVSDIWDYVSSCRCSSVFSVLSVIKAKPLCTDLIICSQFVGVCGIAGVSAFANLIVQSFRFTTYAEGGFSMFGGGGVGGLSGNLAPRYTFGPALFVGWIGAAILVIGGILMCLACRGMTPDNRQRYDGMAYKAPSHHTIYKSDRPRPAYNDSYKAQSMDGPQSNQRFDYV